MSSDRLRVKVLGPLRVWHTSGEEVSLRGTLQRKLLALLVFRRGSVVSAVAAADGLWRDDLPRDPGAALHNHVSRLRQILPAGVVESVGTGYRIDPARLEVDADRLVALLAGEAGSGAVELHRLLTGWHGPAYPELEEMDDARIEAARLEELRNRARESLAEARLDAGELDGLVTELAALIDADPLAERPRGMLMSALAASGRTVEALRAFDDFRRLLGDELGLEPSPVLSAQHRALLAGQGVSGRWPTPSRVPVPPSSLVGRDEVGEQLTTLADHHRLVTLVGPGGVGKTRLLMELGSRQQARQPERTAVWCDLTQADARSALDVVMAALGIDVRPGTAPIERIVEVICEDELVLLLDNCEHVLDPIAALLEAVLAHCPLVRVVATSRERLRVAGEQVCPVPPLPASDEHSPAVELFLQRARAAAPDFAPGPAERTVIIDVVARLDGLPLAIELAAARLHSLELAEIAAGLDHRFSLLSTGLRAAPRHASLAATVSWSFDALDGTLQRTFRALSVFARPFTATDAAAVCGLEPTLVPEPLSALVERSLLQRAPDGTFVMLETLKAFGAELLEDSGEADVVRERHAVWMVDWVTDADRALLQPGRPVLREIDEAMPELSAALAWLVGRDRPEQAARLVVALMNYGFLRARPDVLAWADTVLATDGGELVSEAAELWAASAYAAWMAGDVAAAHVLVERGLVPDHQPGSTRPVARVCVMRGNIELFEGRLIEAAEWYERAVDAGGSDPLERLFNRATLLLAWGYAEDARVESLADELLDEVGDVPTPIGAYVWYCAGEAVLATDADRALRRLVRATDLADATNASFVLGTAGASKASVEARSGDPQAAMRDYRWLIEHWRRAGMWSTQWTMLRSVAQLLERVDRHRDAAVLEGAVRSTRAGHRIFGADAVALDELSTRLRAALGDGAYAAAVRQGGALDGAAAAEHALRAL